LNRIEQHDLSAMMNGLEKRWQWINRWINKKKTT